MIHHIPQRLPEKLGELPATSQGDILSEKQFRRASPEFVLNHGGDIARLFLKITDNMGIVNDRSRFMCQCSPIVKGAYPSPPNWHVDRMPGTNFNLIEHLTQPVSGAIASICSEGLDETTEFIAEGEIILDEPKDTDQVHLPGQYLQDTEGIMNWTTRQIEEQLKAGKLNKENIESNAIYQYDSTFFHKCPQFVHNNGYRIIMRVNTAPRDFKHPITTQDKLVKEEQYYFQLSKDGNRWKRIVFQMHSI